MDSTTFAYVLFGTLIVLFTGCKSEDNPVHVRIPDDDCVISMQDFTRKVVGRTWISVYDSRGYGFAVSYAPQKMYLRFKIYEDGTIQRTGAYWEAYKGACTKGTGNATVIQEDKAIVSMIPGGDFYIPQRVDRFLSSDLNKYLIWLICLSEPDADGKCNQTKFFICIPDFHESGSTETDEDLDDDFKDELRVKQHIPFAKINETMVNCMDLILDETKTNGSHIVFGWTGPDCLHLLDD